MPEHVPATDAVIMAAGRGNRLLPLTHDRPKCLLEVGGEAILTYQIRACAACGVRRIQIVTGHGRELVERACEGVFEGELSFSHNADFDHTNSLFSLGCTTLDPGPGGLLILNSDVLFHRGQLAALIGDPRENVLLAAFGGALGEEEMKIQAGASGRIKAISKQMAPGAGQAENLGILKVAPQTTRRMFELARTPGGVEGLCWAPDAIHYLKDEIEFYALPAETWPWIEIDYLHDLERARSEVWPRILKAEKDRVSQSG